MGGWQAAGPTGAGGAVLPQGPTLEEEVAGVVPVHLLLVAQEDVEALPVLHGQAILIFVLQGEAGGHWWGGARLGGCLGGKAAACSHCTLPMGAGQILGAGGGAGREGRLPPRKGPAGSPAVPEPRKTMAASSQWRGALSLLFATSRP